MDCVFCKIIRREVPGFVIEEDDSIIVFLSLENHPLIVPKKHIVDIFSLDDELASLVMKEAVRVARAMKEGLKCNGIYLTQANGTSAGQDVFHYHVHLYPRWDDREEKHLAVEKRNIAEKIKSALSS